MCSRKHPHQGLCLQTSAPQASLCKAGGLGGLVRGDTVHPVGKQWHLLASSLYVSSHTHTHTHMFTHSLMLTHMHTSPTVIRMAAPAPGNGHDL